MRVLWLVFAAVLVGCGKERAEQDVSTPPKDLKKQSVPLPEPKKASAPAYTNAQLAGVYKMVYTKEEVAAANANGLDLTKDVPTVTFEEDGTFVMGSTGSPGTMGEGTFKVEGKEIVLTLVGDGGKPEKESPRIKVSNGGKSLEFASGKDGRPVRLERT